jgi:hypothetical protein
MVPYVSAAPNQKFIPIAGTADISQGNYISVHDSGPNIVHIIATQNATFLGNFTGTVEIHQSILNNMITQETKEVGQGTFTGNLGEKTGTFTFVTNGHGQGPTLVINWEIIGGTGNFATLHGKGTLTITYTIIDGNMIITGVYSGDVFFNS